VKSEADPLAALVAKAKSADKKDDVAEVDPADVTFPSLLSDTREPTTAAVAVKNARGRLIDPAKTAKVAPEAAVPPPAADQLPVVPLPAGDVLTSTSVTTQPKDDMTSLAAKLSQPQLPDQYAPPGSEGGFQLQVASFKKPEDADRFVQQLRNRGHSAFRQAAYVADRGLWHRVRIGPFKSKYSAKRYQKEFEAKERMSTFIVDPAKVKRRAMIRLAEKKAREAEDDR
jgi:cell division septation protein DedD